MALTTFQESYYLQQNPDVLEAVRNGAFQSAEDHYIRFGEGEGRKPNPYFDPAGYLAQNTDVLGAVNAGVFSSGLQHYEMYGATEGRQPGAADLFDEEAYLAENPDVAEAVDSGVFHSGYEHFVLYGSSEGRSSGVTPPPVDGQTFTLTTNQDIFTGGAGTDVIRGVAGQAVGAQDQTTLNSSDILDGGAGDDTLVVNMTGGQYLGGATIKNIETLQVGTNLAASAFDMNVNQGAYEVTGVETVVYDQITTGETMNVQNIVPVAADGGTPTLHWANEANSIAGTIGATYRQASTNGTDDDQAITLENVTTGTLNIGPGIESFTIESTGTVANNTLANSGNVDTGAGNNGAAADLISSGSLTKVVLTGDVAIGKAAGVVSSTTATTNGLTDRNATVDTGLTTATTASNLLSVGSRVTEVDASEMTGAANVRFVAKTDGTDTNVTFLGGEAGDYVEFNRGNVSATGGEGDDTFAFVVPVGTLVNSGFTSADSLVGGEGSDTVQIGLNGVGTYNLNTTEFNNKTGIDVLDLRGTTNNVTLADAFVAGADSTLTVRTDKIVQTSDSNSANPTNSSTLENQSVSTINLTELADNRAINILGGSGQERVVGDNASINANSSIDGGLGMDSLTVVNSAVLDANDLANVSNLEMLNLVDNVTGASTFNVTITESFLARNTTGTNGTKTFVVASEAAAGGVVLTAGDTVTIDVSDLYSAGALKSSVTSAGYRLNLQDLVASGATVNLVQGGTTLASYAGGLLTAGALPTFGDVTTLPSAIAYTAQTGAVTNNILAVLPNGTGTGGDGGTGGGGGVVTGGNFTLTAANAILGTTFDSSNVTPAGRLSAGVDTITAGANLSGALIQDATAGDGDVLNAVVAGALANNPFITNIETINITANAANFSLANVTGATGGINVTGGAATFTNAQSQTINLASGYTSTLTVSATAGASETVTVGLGGTAAGTQVTDGGANNIETVALNVSANSTVTNLTSGGANGFTMAGAGNLTIAGALAGALNASGSTGTLTISAYDGDTITGTNQADSFTQVANNTSSINGGGGNDAFVYGAFMAATDTLNGGDGTDTLSFTDAGGATTDIDNITNIEVITLGNAVTAFNLVEANLSAGQILTINGAGVTTNTNTIAISAALETDGGRVNITGGAGNDTLTGGTSNDTLSGGSGADSLIGGGGADSLVGGEGNDTITGGAGADTFVLVEAGLASNAAVVAVFGDTITDFQDGNAVATQDVLQISAASLANITGFVANAAGITGAAGAQGANFLVAGAGAQVANQAYAQLLFNTTTGVLSIDADGTGVGAAVTIGTVGVGATLTAADFLFV